MEQPPWTPAPRCWIATDGSAGMENQCVGLAESLGLSPDVKRLAIRAPWSRLPPALWPRALSAPGPDGDRLEPPWPDLLITCGKRSAAPSIAVRAASGGATFTVHIQDPRVHPRNFDLVIAPRHDDLTGPNVLTTTAALHRVTPEKLQAAAERFAADLATLPRPLVAVLIGGSNGRHCLTAPAMRAVAGELLGLCREAGAGLAVTASRRTGPENEAILRATLAGAPAAIWDGAGDNPYFGYLALADAILVTCDSVSMVSEACSTGKPVYVIGLDGYSGRIERFHRSLEAAGMTRRFAGRLEPWTYQPPDDTAAAAAAVRRLLDARRAA